MTRAVVYDRCVEQARSVAATLRRHAIASAVVHPTDFDLTFEQTGGVPDLIVAELQMPMFSGFELVRRVRTKWSARELPIVAFTAIDDALAWEKARELGANEVVYRGGPTADARLAAAVARSLGRAEPASVAAAAARAPSLWSRLFSRPAATVAA